MIRPSRVVWPLLLSLSLGCAAGAVNLDIGVVFRDSFEEGAIQPTDTVFRMDIDVTGDTVPDFLLAHPDSPQDWHWRVYDGWATHVVFLGTFNCSPYGMRHDAASGQMVCTWGHHRDVDAVFIARTTLAPAVSSTTTTGPLASEDPAVVAEIAEQEAWRSAESVTTVRSSMCALLDPVDPTWTDYSNTVVAGLRSLRLPGP